MLELASEAADKIAIVGTIVYFLATAAAALALACADKDSAKGAIAFLTYALATIFLSCVSSSIVSALREAAVATP